MTLLAVRATTWNIYLPILIFARYLSNTAAGASCMCSGVYETRASNSLSRFRTRLPALTPPTRSPEVICRRRACAQNRKRWPLPTAAAAAVAISARGEITSDELITRHLLISMSTYVPDCLLPACCPLTRLVISLSLIPSLLVRTVARL